MKKLAEKALPVKRANQFITKSLRDAYNCALLEASLMQETKNLLFGHKRSGAKSSYAYNENVIRNAYEKAFKYFQKRLEFLGLEKPQAPLSLNAEKIAFARKTQHLSSLMDSLTACQFVWGASWHLYGPAEIVKLVTAVTGWDITFDELLDVGERRLNMMRAFNALEGIGRDCDQLPEKFYQQPLDGGPTEGWKLDKSEFEEALTEYYRQCGWDINTGTPARETLARLGLEWIEVS